VKIQSISIEGFWGYREPVHVDIDGIPLLVAVGHNGSGKSALVVSAVLAGLYGKFPTRTVEESITHGADIGYITVEFTVAGTLYRVARAHPAKGAATASVSRMDDGMWKMLTEKGVREATNKVTEILGMDYDTAVMTWVAEQGQYGAFANAQPAARFKMLAGVFDLAKYGPMQRAAQEKLRKAKEAVANAEGRVAELNDDLIDDDAREGDQLSDEDLAAQAKAAHAALDEAAAALAAHQQNDPALAVKRAQSALDAVKGVRLAELRAAEQELATLREARDTRPTQRDREIAEANARHDRDAAAATSRAETNTQGANRRLHAAELELAALVERATSVPTLQQAEADAHAAHTAAIQTLEVARATVTERELALDRAHAAHRAAQVAVADAVDTLEALAHAGDCYACGQHISEQVAKNLRDAQQQVIHAREADAIDADEAVTEATAALNTARKDVQAAARAAHDAEAAVHDARRALATAERAAADAERVREAISREQETIAGIRTELDETLARLTADRDEAVARATEACDTFLASVVERGKAAAEKVSALRKPTPAEEELERDLTAAENIALGDSRYTMETERLTAARDEARAKATALDTEIGRRAEIARRQAEQAERIAAAKNALARAQEDAAVYTDLVAAYSPGGIPSMILASVIDDLNAAINVTLAELSAGELEVRLSTSRETAGGSQESKVTVYVDTPTGPRAYEALSGGQRFRVDLAIRMGLASIIAGGTGTPIETFILDEGWGSLDEAGIRSTLEVLGRLSEQVNVLTVSHVDSVREAFPARIEVTTNEGTAQATVIR